MRVHRSAQRRNFTALPNVMLQCRQLSYTARGLLVDLLSRPDGWREDAQRMADTSPQGRGAIRKALRELTAAGFYRVEKLRMADGTIRTVTHVYDTPQPVAPGVARPDSGGSKGGGAEALLKNLVKRPSLPTLPAWKARELDAALKPQAEAGGRGEPPAEQALVEEVAEGRDLGEGAPQERVSERQPPGQEPPEEQALAREAPVKDVDPAAPEPQEPPESPEAPNTPEPPDERLLEAAATLFRVLRPEPRLRLGAAEACRLAPLVAQWLERGSTAADLARALLPGLPVTVHSAVGMLRSRLERKMPPERAEAPAPRSYAECFECHDPVPDPGHCRACAGLAGRPVGDGRARGIASAGAARVRAACDAARSAAMATARAAAGGRAVVPV